jgi:D-3-phosphoglycerate dehydrogenase
MIRILNIEPEGYCEEARRLLRSLGELVEAPLDRRQLIEAVGGFDVLIVRLAHQIDSEVLEAGSWLKAIVTATTGLDHIDVAWAGKRNVRIVSLKGEAQFLEAVSATAEHTWALLLALLRRIPHAFYSVRAGGWDRDAFRGNELDGKRLGIVGLGRIGRKVARYGQAFGMQVKAYDPYAQRWAEGVGRTETLAALLSESDVLTLHVPLSNETLGLIGKEEMARMPEGSVLINTSRGQIVDEEALIHSLEKKILAGAALDVIQNERHMGHRRNSPIFAYAAANENLLITPHIGGATYESMAKTEIFMAQKLIRMFHSEADPQL